MSEKREIDQAILALDVALSQYDELGQGLGSSSVNPPNQSTQQLRHHRAPSAPSILQPGMMKWQKASLTQSLPPAASNGAANNSAHLSGGSSKIKVERKRLNTLCGGAPVKLLNNKQQGSGWNKKSAALTNSEHSAHMQQQQRKKPLKGKKNRPPSHVKKLSELAGSLEKAPPVYEGAPRPGYGQPTPAVESNLDKENGDLKSALVEAVQLRVKHTNRAGSQAGTLMLKYHLQAQSKSIACNRCGIFFAASAFLGHLHGEFGEKVKGHASALLELDVESPSAQEWLAWERFLETSRNLASSLSRKRQTATAESGGGLENVDDLLTAKRQNFGGCPDQQRPLGGPTPPVIMGGQSGFGGRSPAKHHLQKYLGEDDQGGHRPPAATTLPSKSAASSFDLLRHSRGGGWSDDNHSPAKNVVTQKYVEGSQGGGFLPAPAAPPPFKPGVPSFDTEVPVPDKEWRRTKTTFTDTNRATVVDQEAATKEDPLFILQTTRELIDIACQKIIQKGEMTWHKLYLEEKKMRLEAEEKLKHYQNHLTEELQQSKCLKDQIAELMKHNR